MTCFNYHLIHFWCFSQLAFTCFKTIMETLEQCVKYVQSYWKGHQSGRCAAVFIANFDQNLHIVLVYQLLTLSTWIQARVVLDREESFIDEKLSSYLCSCRKGHISLWCLVSTKRLHILKQTCSFQLQVYLSMYELLVDRKC